MLELVRCINKNEFCKNLIEIGNKYWIDYKKSITNDNSEEFVYVYSNNDEKNFVGILNLNHFEIIYRNLKYMSLCGFINTNTSFLLIDIIEWCTKNTYNQLSGELLRYIKDNELYTTENIYKEFIVKSKPLQAFIDEGNGNEYMKYLGYSLECVE